MSNNKYIREVYSSPNMNDAWIVKTSDDSRLWIVKTAPDGWVKRRPYHGPKVQKVSWSTILDACLMLCGVPKEAREGVVK